MKRQWLSEKYMSYVMSMMSMMYMAYMAYMVYTMDVEAEYSWNGST